MSGLERAESHRVFWRIVDFERDHHGMIDGLENGPLIADQMLLQVDQASAAERRNQDITAVAHLAKGLRLQTRLQFMLSRPKPLKFNVEAAVNVGLSKRKSVAEDDESDIANLSRAVVEYVMQKKKLSPGEIAELLGVDKSHISLVRNGKRNLRIAHLGKLANAAGTPLQMIIAHAMPIDVDAVPKHLQASLKKYENLLQDGANFLLAFEEAHRDDAVKK